MMKIDLNLHSIPNHPICTFVRIKAHYHTSPLFQYLIMTTAAILVGLRDKVNKRLNDELTFFLSTKG